MFKGSLITLTTANVGGKIVRGRLELHKGKAMRGLRGRLLVPIKNTRAGAVTTPLTTAERETLLSKFDYTLSYGYKGQHKPFTNVNGKRMRELQKYCYSSEMEGFDNAVTGAARTLPSGATTVIELWPSIPTGRFARVKNHRNWRGVGRSQALTIELELKFLTRALGTGLEIDGNVTFEALPDVFSCKGDIWTTIPAWHEATEKDKKYFFQSGLPLLVAELTNAHSAATLTNFSLHVDGEVMHDQVSAAEVLVDGNDTELPADGDLTGSMTVLYQVEEGSDFEQLQTGSVTFNQNVKDMGEVLVGIYHVPLVADDAARLDMSEAAKLRNKELKTVSAAEVAGMKYFPNRLKFAAPYRMLDRDDAEWEDNPGSISLPNSPIVVESAPDSMLERARAARRGFAAVGEMKSFNAVAERLASAHYGAVQSTRGLNGGGSKVLANTLRTLGS